VTGDGRLVRAAAAVAFASGTGLTVAGLWLLSAAGEPLWPSAVATVGLYPFTAVGALIAVRRPRNPVAWLCLLVGVAFALEAALWGVAFYGFAHPGTVPAPAVWAVVGGAFVMPALFLMASLLILLFPDGRLPSPRWRWLARLTSILLAVVFVAGLVAPQQSDWARPTIDNPLGVEALEWLGVTFVALFGCVLASVVALVGRFRRSTGIERLQLRWLATAGTAAVILWFLAIFVAADLLDHEGAALASTVVGFALLPVAIGVAVLRFRLFEIDRLISRTVTYGTLVAVLFGLYLAGVLVFGSLFPRQGEFGVAVSTLAVAALFHPLRRRVQRAVDRRFNRSRYDAQRELERFTGSLRDEVDLDELTDDLLATVGATVQPSSASVWIREPTT
jgi:hypothetical protein